MSVEACRDLNWLSLKVAPFVVEFLTGPLADDLLRVSEPVGGETADLWSARRGDYRVLLCVDRDKRTLLVVRITHRSDAYRGR